MEHEEQVLKESMDPVVASTVSGKRILLFKEMLQSTCYPDTEVVKELRQGAKLVGEVPATGVLPSKFVPATSTADALKRQSELLKPKAFYIARSSGSADNDSEVWLQTLDEVKAGWLRGPLCLSEIDATCPITRRFGFQQGETVRLIDGYSDSGVNVCVTTSEAPALRTLDTAAAILCRLFSSRMQLSKSTTLSARTFDLKSACRQIGLH